MKTLTVKSSFNALALALALPVALLSSCDSEENVAPSKHPVIGEEAGVTDENSDDSTATDETEVTSDDGDSSDDTADTDEDPEDTDEDPEDTDEDPEDTDEDPEDTDEDPEDTDEDPPSLDGGSDVTEPDPVLEDGGTEPVEPTDTDVTATDTENPPDPVTETDTDVTETDTDVPPEPAECVENDDACFSCPVENEEFLHQCTNARMAIAQRSTTSNVSIPPSTIRRGRFPRFPESRAIPRRFVSAIDRWL